MNLTHKNEHCMTGEQKEDNLTVVLLEGAIENCTGVDYVNRKGTKIEILPFDAPKKVHSVVVGRTGSGMNCFERNEVLTKITTVLESYDEVVIEEAIAKNHLLNFKFDRFAQFFFFCDEQFITIFKIIIIIKLFKHQRDGFIGNINLIL
jgi:hypothetical protein